MRNLYPFACALFVVFAGSAGAEDQAAVRYSQLSEPGPVFELAKLDRVPKPLVQTPPQYPYAMRANRISGAVLVDFIVDSRGNVRNAYAVQADNREFALAAVAAVAHWKFRPGFHQGQAVATHMQVPIAFADYSPLGAP